MNFNKYVAEKLKKSEKYVVSLLKWLLLSSLMGVLGGIAGVVFHFFVEGASRLRQQFPFLLFFLPIAGLLIVFLYRVCGMQNDKGTNTVISSIRSSEKIPILTAPLILIGTFLTHLCGGSSGREGAALQIGGSIGSFLGGAFRLDERDNHVMTMCGMSALFSAVFGTPLTAALFSMEVISVGIIYYNAFFPCLFSAVIAHVIASLLGVPASSFNIGQIPVLNALTLLRVIVLAALCALLSIVFVASMHKFSRFFAKTVKNSCLRTVIGAISVILCSLLFRSPDYNGVGMSVVKRALEDGSAYPAAFLFKLVLTTLTLSSGFKGGEIVPTFFIGSTFGVFVSQIIGLDARFAASVGLVATFCGVVNCPVTSIILSVELFGSEGIVFFALASAVSYILSGYYGLYSSQKIMYSKISSTYINKDAK